VVVTEPQAPEEPGAAASNSAGEIASDSILIVDDDQNILDAFQRQFRKRFRIQTATGGEQGLEALAEKGPFAVVVSDLKMPGMDGVEFLSAVRARSQDTVRIMLTGQADLSGAIAAVNQGSIFRFLVKPCTATILEKVLEAGLHQYRLVVAERQLTEQTLLGCVEVLVEMLTITQPAAFNQAKRVRRYVEQLGSVLRLAHGWQFETAALLSPIGSITLPEIAEKATDPDASTVPASPSTNHTAAAARILEKIPRLETVAHIIREQNTPWKKLLPGKGGEGEQIWIIGAQLLKTASDFDTLRERGSSSEQAIERMTAQPDLYSPQMLAGLAGIAAIERGDQILRVPLWKLEPKMILEEPLCGTDGVRLIAKGQELTTTLLERLGAFAEMLSRDQTVKVRLRGDRK